MCKEDAEADLKQARTAQTREEYCDILRQLQKIQRAEAMVDNNTKEAPHQIAEAVAQTASDQEQEVTRPRKRVRVEVQASARQAEGDRCIKLLCVHIELEETCTGLNVMIDQSHSGVEEERPDLTRTQKM